MKYNKSISSTEGLFLNRLNEMGKNWFCLEDACIIMKEKKRGTVCVMINKMVGKGLLMKIRKEYYWVVPFEQDAKDYLPNWHLLAEPLVGNQRYYIGYYSALQIHGLITQPSLKEQIVREQPKTQHYILNGVDFQLISHNKKHFFGYKNVWVDSFNKVSCSDLEKTFVDCLFKPNYAGGIVEVGKALWMAKEQLDYDKLLKYVKQFGNQAVVKRLGYLLDALNITNSIAAELKKMRSTSISPLDVKVSNKGKVNTKWNIIQNVDIKTIINAINN